MTNLYRPMFRPASFCTLPEGLKWDYAETPSDYSVNRPEIPVSRYRFGIITTERTLTDRECSQFDLQPI